MLKHFFPFSRFLKYLLFARHHGGFGIHSPFAFNLITNVMECKCNYYCYDIVEKQRKLLLKNSTSISINDLGTGNFKSRRICDIARFSVKSRIYAQLIFRLAVNSKPENKIELGTSLGITTAYLALSDRQSPTYSLEGCSNIQIVAKETLENCNVGKNVHLILGNIDEQLPLLLSKLNNVGFVFFDANHTFNATINYFNMCVKKINDNSVFVFDDIHSSLEMERAWNMIIKDKRVKVSFDIYSMGIVYFNSCLQKQDYIYLFF